MEASKKRSGDSVKSSSPKKQKQSKKDQRGKGKKQQDQNKPKRPMSAFFIFLDEYRKRPKENDEQKSTKVSQETKAAAAEWKIMSDEDKQPYVDRYNKAKAEYDEKMKLLKPAKDSNKPKKPVTAFLIYLSEIRTSLKEKGITGPEVSKRAGEKWREMAEDEKKVYHEKQKKAKDKFDKEMEEYLAKNPAPPPQKKKVKKSKAKIQEESESEEEEEEEEEEDEEEEEEEEDEDEEDEESD